MITARQSRRPKRRLATAPTALAMAATILATLLTPAPAASQSDSLGDQGRRIVDGHIIEGDLIVGKVNRASVTTVHDLWPNNTIPYTFEAGLDPWVGDEFMFAVAKWESKTNVRFRPKTAADRNYLVVVDDMGCASWAGILGGAQKLSITPGREVCAVHEVGHAIGLGHEHSRADRDEHIDIFDANFKSAASAANWRKDEADQPVGPYDVRSVMHYSSWIGAKPGTVVAKTKDGKLINPNYRDVSWLDVEGVNEIYPAIAGSFHQQVRRDGKLHSRDTPVVNSTIDWSRRGTWLTTDWNGHTITAESGVVINGVRYISRRNAYTHFHLRTPVVDGRLSQASTARAHQNIHPSEDNSRAIDAPVMAQNEWVVDSHLWQMIWQGYPGRLTQWTRKIPLPDAERLGMMRWNSPVKWTNRAQIGGNPIEAAAAWVIDDTYHEGFYRNGVRYRRSADISSGFTWSDLPSFSKANSTTPGSGPRTSDVAYYVK